MYRYSARVSYPLINTSGWRSRESANQLDPAAAEPEALTTPTGAHAIAQFLTEEWKALWVCMCVCRTKM
jgi:hypothetical protein